MKKTNSMRVAVAMLALTLITSCFVGGTFAKYTTSGSGNDTARVAKFGVTVTAGGSTFAKAYVKDDTDAAEAITQSVISSNNNNVVAPGTRGEIELFTLSGAPEVAVRIEATMSNTQSIYLKYRTDGNEIKFIPNVDEWGNGGSTDIPIGYADDNMETYSPIQWTLLKDGVEVTVTDNGSATLEDIKNWLRTNITGDYAPNTNLATELGAKYTLKWEWPFDVDDNDADYLDTILGDLQAELTPDGITEESDYNLTESFDFSITVTQID